MATATPRSAVMIGMPAASSEPKVTASTASATSTPIPSVGETWTDLLANSWPPRWTSSGDAREGPWRSPPRGRRWSRRRAGRAGRRAGPGPARPGRSPTTPACCASPNGSVAISTWSTRAQLPDHRLDLAAVVAHLLALGGDEQDLAGRAGHLGEALRQDVDALLRLGAGDGQVVLERSAEADGEGAHGDQDQRPEGEDPLGPPGHRVAEPVEEGRHVGYINVFNSETYRSA